MGKTVHIPGAGRINIDNPGTWRKYKKELCKSCISTCCTLLVEATAKDLIRLGLTTEWEVEDSVKKLIKRLKKEKIIKRYNFKSRMFVLEQGSGGDCLFLDKNRLCSVYENRPGVCRKHPEILGPRLGYCPYIPQV